MSLNTTVVKDGISTDEQMDITSVFGIMIQCFGLILIGYLTGTRGLITPTQSKGISTFISTFALPALIFTSLATFDLTKVDWPFVGLIFFSKTIIFVCVTAVTMLLTKPVNLGKAALYAMFCTQGNDFAIGYPILMMLYGDTSKKEFPNYLYILSPIQLLILNPIGCILLEYQSNTDPKYYSKLPSRSVSKTVFINLICNPINQMTVLGICWNLIFGNQLSLLISGLLDTLAKSFSATALFLLGLSLTGRFSQFRDVRKLILPCILVTVKLILLPIVLRFSIELGATGDPQSVSEKSSFGFLFGTIPTAPSPFIYALEYQIQPDLIATSMVICTVISCPLMFLSANMVRTLNTVTKNYNKELSQFLSLMSSIALPCLIWLLIVFVVSKRYRFVTHRCTFMIILSQICMCIGGYLLKFLNTEDIQNDLLYHVQYLFMVIGLLSVRIWTSLLAITLCILQVQSLCFILKILNRLMLCTLFFTIGLIAVIIYWPSYQNIHSLDPNFEFGGVYSVIMLNVLVLGLFLTISSIVIQQRYSIHLPEQSQSASLDSEIINDVENQSENFITFNDDEERLLTHRNISSSVKVEITDLTEPSTSNRVLDIDLEDLIPEGFDDFCQAQSNFCDMEHKKQCRRSINEYRLQTAQVLGQSDNSMQSPIQFHEAHHVFSHLLLLLVSCLSMFVSLEVSIGKIFVENSNAILIELEYLDILLNFGSGVFMFLLFGMDLDAMFRLLRQKFFFTPSISGQSFCEMFVEQYIIRCKSEIQFTICNEQEEICYVFRDEDLKNWLLEKNLVKNGDVNILIETLSKGKIIQKVKSEQYFNNQSFLYKFMI